MSANWKWIALIVFLGAGVTAQAAAVCLRGGIAIEGTLVIDGTGFATIETEHGPITFPEWLIDRSGAAAERLDCVKTYKSLDDPELTSRLPAINEFWRGQNQERNKARAALRPWEERLDKARAAKDAEELAIAVHSLVEALPEWAPALQEEGSDVAAHAWGSLSDMLRTVPGQDAAIRAGQAAFEAFVLKGDLYKATDCSEIRKSLQPVLRNDPREWTEAVRMLNLAEDFSDWSNLPQPVPWWEGEQWRWDHVGADWEPKLPLPARFRLISPTGDIKVVPAAPPPGPEIVSVWAPGIRTVGGNNAALVMTNMGVVHADDSHGVSQWWQVFWCPVAKKWKRDTVPELLARFRFVAHRALHQYKIQEQSDFSRVAKAFQRYESNLRSLASSWQEMETEKKRPVSITRPRPPRDWSYRQKYLDEASAAVVELQDATDRIVRRRVAMQRGFLRLRQIEAAAAEANKGVAVDLTAFRDPPAVTARLDKNEERDAILAALKALDPVTVEATLGDKAPIRNYAEDADIVKAVTSIADDVSPTKQRKAAQRLLKRWGKPAGRE